MTVTSTYAFWFNCDSEHHALDICHEHGLTLRLVRTAPELTHVVKVNGRGGAHGQVRTHIRGNLLHCRAIKECTAADALALNQHFGYGAVMPEEVGTLVG